MKFCGKDIVNIFRGLWKKKNEYMDKITAHYYNCVKIMIIFACVNITHNTLFTMPRLKDGFPGERSIVLPERILRMEENDPLVKSLYITDIGHYPMARHHYRRRDEAIDQYVLIYCVDGSGWYAVNGNRYEVRKNQYFILPAGLPHEYGATEDENWTIYWVHFKGEHAAIYSEGANTPQTINITVNSRISERNNIFEEILSALHFGSGIEDLRYASSLLHHYLASMRYLRQYRNQSRMDASHSNKPFVGSNDTGIVEAAIHFMRENIERRVTLQDVADYVGYSPSHFSGLFKQETGSSPLAYFNRLKIEYACHLMKVTDLHINQICYKVGFNDSLYFSRLFSKTVGMSPRKYRETQSPIDTSQPPG